MPQSAVIFSFFFKCSWWSFGDWKLEVIVSDAAGSDPNSLPASFTVSATTLLIASRYVCGMRMMTSNPE